MKIINKFFFKLSQRISGLIAVLITLFLFGGLTVAVIGMYLNAELPSTEALKTVQYQVPLRVYTEDGKLIAEFGEKRRMPVPLDQIPPTLVNAFIATEDQRFWEHGGVDFRGLMRASFYLVTTGQKVQGGSTITMQVARNFFLNSKKTFTRKFKEILLAFKINKELTKDKILELYLNKIYLGNRAYGVAAAAQVYYGETLDQLTLPQMAMIAGLPKAPSSINPLANPAAAKDRRDHVLERMYEQKYITKEQYDEAVKAPLTASYHGPALQVQAPYVAEMVRDTMYSLYGEDAYTSGFNVYTTINSVNQNAANTAVRSALLAYDQRHGYRGAEKNLGTPTSANLANWGKQLAAIPKVSGLVPAAVVNIQNRSITALLANGKTVDIPWAGLSWARPSLANGRYQGAAPKQAADIVKLGDVIRVDSNSDSPMLSQVPQIEGALISLNPQDGAIEALVGGFDFNQSSFNRVTQAERQSGSSFKPYIYTAALAKGFTLATVINDAPIVMEDPSLGQLWRPQNDTKQFYGPTRLRYALTESRNLVSIRLLQSMGIPYALDYISHFGFNPNSLPNTPSLALGAGTITPFEQARGYAVFANGGYRITPYFIEKITNGSGQTVFQANPAMACEPCLLGSPAPTGLTHSVAPVAVDPQDNYLITSAMKDVIQQGTGGGAKILDRSDVAGKTGTTNDWKDTWFAGFNSDVVTVTWVGFDQPRSIYEYGARAALPMWVDYMRVALAGKPLHTMPQPPGIVSMRIDKTTGEPADATDQNSMMEYFRAGTEPQTNDNNGANPYNLGGQNSSTVSQSLF